MDGSVGVFLRNENIRGKPGGLVGTNGAAFFRQQFAADKIT